MRVLHRAIEPGIAACADPTAAPSAELRMLAGWPGPAFVLAADGVVLDANDAAGAFVDGPRHDALLAAVRGGRTASVVAVIGSGPATKRLECVVLPVVSGETALVLARDVTLEAALRDALVDSRQRYKDLVELSGDFCWETGPDGRFVFVSPRGAVGWTAEALIGRDPAEFVDDASENDAALPFTAKTRIDDVELWFSRRDGGLACLAVAAIPLVARDGAWLGARGFCRDVTDAHARDAALARAGMRERLLAHVVRCVRDEIEPARMIAAAASATARALEAVECRIVVLPEEADAPGNAQGIDADGALVARAVKAGRAAEGESGGRRQLAIATMFRGRPNGTVIVERDCSAPLWSAEEHSLAADVAAQVGIALAQIDRERRLEALSRTDTLTGLLNRRAFEAELAERLDRGGLSSASGALVFIDLDNFKPVNDTHGHARGDEALRAVARLLLKRTRAGDLVARLGGDEFALWLERTDAPTAARRAGDLIAASGTLAPFSGDPDRPLGFSIGAAVFAPGSAETLAALTARADAAMYAVKHDGKSGFAMAPPAGDTERNDRRSAST